MGPTKPDHSQLNGTSGSGLGRFLGWTQKVYSSGWNTALRSPSAREVSTTETGGQEPTAMDAEAQKEPTVPSSGMAMDEPVIPIDLECQVRTTEVTVAQEMVAPVREEEEPVGSHSFSIDSLSRFKKG